MKNRWWDKRVFIIAEAGVNHNGSIEMAKELVNVAIDSGADAVKFQSFRTENNLCISTQKAPYQKETTSDEESLFDKLVLCMLKCDHAFFQNRW